VNLSLPIKEQRCSALYTCCLIATQFLQGEVVPKETDQIGGHSE
jgi:hypothetical protein